MIKTVAPALKALVSDLIDYAGLYPPAKLPIGDAIANFAEYESGSHSWMLRRFVVGAGELDKVPDSLNGKLSVLTDSEQKRAASLETSTILAAARPVYCEIPFTDLEKLDEIKSSGCFAKMRTGGVKPEAIPSPLMVSSFILACAERRLPFKATAGLHHPIRKEYALTYDADAPRGTMHGFINVLMASAFAWSGDKKIEKIIEETDPTAFRFDDKACWRDKSLSAEQIRDARQNFMHAIGSCSFEEPVQDLQALGLL
ncbi:hypothetical protein KF728_25785 [Candidatus Obscuribacterales bacterium]|nr:hypothetical protein [Candidatus Obscuribacterales bacterium]MBX3153591.1 hypothetical protein [Candidatus Obscuribacterales bacterium]